MVKTKLWVIALVACQTGSSEEARKPVCNAETVGQFWPAEANQDRATLARLAHCGVLEVCVHGSWHYHWDQMTIRLDQLRKSRARRSADSASTACTTPAADLRPR